MPKKAKKKADSSKKSAAASKPAVTKPAKTAASGKRGKRYTSAQKAKILTYVDEVNTKKGRGGAAAASRKFGISQITIGQWMKKSGSKPAAQKAKPGRKPGRKPAATGGDFSAKLRRLADVHEAIIKSKSKLAALEAEYAELKKSL